MPDETFESREMPKPSWVKAHVRATLAIAFTFILWVGIVVDCPWPWGLIGTGGLGLLCVLLSYLPGEKQ